MGLTTITTVTKIINFKVDFGVAGDPIVLRVLSSPDCLCVSLIAPNSESLKLPLIIFYKSKQDKLIYSNH